jgi:predicted permease
MASFLGEASFAARRLRRTPGFTATAVLTLATAIGACTVLYSVVYGVVLRPLPYPDPDDIVQLEQIGSSGARGQVFSDPDFEDLRDQTSSFTALAEFDQSSHAAVTIGDVALRVRIANVSRGFFDVFHTEPAIGRRFSDDEAREGGPLVVIVSSRFWRERFAGVATMSEARLSVNGSPHSVIGVMPDGFAFPPDIDVWMPREARFRNPFRTGQHWRVMARIRAGIGLPAARADASLVAKRLKTRYGSDTEMSDVAIVPLQDELVGSVRPLLFVLLASVGLLLAVACANLANVLLARMTTRRRELAVRAALGATGVDLIVPVVAESCLVSACGGALGILMAAFVVHSTSLIEAANLPPVGAIGLNWAVVAFAVGVTWLTALTLSLVAAWRERRPDIGASLKESSRGHTATRTVGRLRDGLVIAQLMISVVLLIGAALLGRSLILLLDQDLGFRTIGILAMDTIAATPPRLQVSPDAVTVDNPSALPRQARLRQQIIERLAALPGVVDVGGIDSVPLTGQQQSGAFLIVSPGDLDIERISLKQLVARLQEDPAHTHTGNAEFRVATAGYFRAMDIPLVRGRLFDERDTPSAPHVAVISETLARNMWPHDDPIGVRVEYGGVDGDRRVLTIVGVVGDVRERGFDQPPPAMFYANDMQRPLIGAFEFTFVIRTANAPGAMVADARRVLRDVAPDAPPRFRTVEEVVDASVAGRRFTFLLSALFAGGALVVAVLGIYGVITFVVTERSHEFGVRIALGANVKDVQWLVLRQAGRLIAIGVGGGVMAALAMNRVLAAQLFGIRSTDPVTYAGVVGFLVIIALVACELPALRASRVDPATILKSDG